jgi:hypothetical protein
VPLRPAASGPPRPSCHSFNDYSRTPGCLIVSAVGTPSKVSNIERNENMVLEDGQQGYPPRPVFNAHSVTCGFSQTLGLSTTSLISFFSRRPLDPIPDNSNI